jgi:REP element-mobilizing transposase RayT
MLISIPLKNVVARMVGFIKGKGANRIAGVYYRRKKDFTGLRLWAGSYFAFTTGGDGKTIRAFIGKCSHRSDKSEG